MQEATGQLRAFAFLENDTKPLLDCGGNARLDQAWKELFIYDIVIESIMHVKPRELFKIEQWNSAQHFALHAAIFIGPTL